MRKLLESLEINEDDVSEAEEKEEPSGIGIFDDQDKATELRKDITDVMKKHGINPMLVDFTIVGVDEKINQHIVTGFSAGKGMKFEDVALYLSKTLPTILRLMPPNFTRKEKVAMLSRMLLIAN